MVLKVYPQAHHKKYHEKLAPNFITNGTLSSIQILNQVDPHIFFEVSLQLIMRNKVAGIKLLSMFNGQEWC